MVHVKEPESENVPEGHWLHVFIEGDDLNVPAGQARHVFLSPTSKVPAGHGEQTPLVKICPALQVIHEVAPAPLVNEPTGQLIQAENKEAPVAVE
jgi:hypothetical protein